MDLYEEILIHVLEGQKTVVYFPDLKSSAAEIVDSVCYRALKKIKAVIEDDSLQDEECFQKIEEIICVLEKIGANGGSRHDFC